MTRLQQLLLTLVLLNFVGLYVFFDDYKPFNSELAIKDEGGYVWSSVDAKDIDASASAYSVAMISAKKIRTSFLDKDYRGVENTIKNANLNGYTPWHLGSWTSFYFRQFIDEHESNVTEDDINRAKKWIEHSPNNSYAKTYLGRLYYKKGAETRGTKFRNLTPKENFIGMKRYLKLATIELNKALDLNPNNTTASYNSMLVAQMTCDYKSINHHFEETVNYSPDYYHIYRMYLNTLQPKWCGSVNEMFDFANNYTSNKTPYTALSLLVAQAHENRAREFAESKHLWQPITDYLGLDYYSYSNKYYRYFENEKAWQDYSKANLTVFEKFPNLAGGLLEYAKTAEFSGRKQTAMKYYELAMNADAAYIGERAQRVIPTTALCYAFGNLEIQS